MNQEEKIRYIIKNILPDIGDMRESIYDFVRQFSDHDLNTVIMVHSLDAAGILTEKDLKSLRAIFEKYGRVHNIEISMASEIPSPISNISMN